MGSRCGPHGRPLRTVVVLALCASLAAPVVAAAWATVDWTYASSEHFQLYTTGGNRRAREALTYFERVHAFLADTMKLGPPPRRPTQLILFSNAREFSPYRMSEAAVAFYRPGPDRDYIVMQSLGSEAEAIVAHEYAHLMTARSGARYPLWLNEGLAEYLSTVSAAGGFMTVGRAPDDRVQDLATDRMIALDRLFAVTRDSPEYRSAAHAGMFYAESWALTHMLLANDRYSAQSARFLSLVSGGTPTAQALLTVYGKTLKAVFDNLTDYVGDGRFSQRTLAYAAPPAQTPFVVRVASPFEADLSIANMLATGRENRARARAAFEDLALQHPDNVALLESRAAFEARSNGPQAARDYLARAVALGSTTARTFRDYAALMASTNPEQQELLLRTAVSLDPADVRSRVQLGFALLLRDPAGALDAIAPVTDFGTADAFDGLRLQASAYLALGHLDRAREAGRQLERLAVGRPQRAMAVRVLASIERVQVEREGAERR